MFISKTLFKNLSRCPRYYGMEHLYRDFGKNSFDYELEEKDEAMQDVLDAMFNEFGESKIDLTNDQLETMQSFYNQIEIIAGDIIQKKFSKNVQYSLDTKEQKYFEYNSEHDLYCYLDGYLEEKEYNAVFEVKATTLNKFVKLGKENRNAITGAKLFDKYFSIFEFNTDGILVLREDLYENPYTDDLPEKKYLSNREKLFDRYQEAGKYVFDLAVQRYIIEQSLKQRGKHDQIMKMKYYLVVLNPAYVFDGTYQDGVPVYLPDKKGNEIICFVDLTKITQEYMPIIEAIEKRVNEYIVLNSTNDGKLGLFCERNKTTQCKYFDVCYKDVPEKNSIFTYISNHHGFKDSIGNKYDRYDLLNDGYFKAQDIPYDYLNRRINVIQRQVMDTLEPYINKRKIMDGIKQIKYPVFHLDFETFPCPLPRFYGESPYSQSVFQFSLHIEKEPGVCDKEVDHYEYLSVDNEDHREELISKMIEYIDLDSGGSIVVYNQAFEKTRLRELSEIFPKYKTQLLKMIDMLFDLLYVTKTNTSMYEELGYETEDAKLYNMYFNDLNGSYSIKKVLPLFSNLTYSNMEVGNGMEAVVTYATFNQLLKDDKNEYKKKYNALVEYCKQDTWAMFEVLNGLKKM